MTTIMIRTNVIMMTRITIMMSIIVTSMTMGTITIITTDDDHDDWEQKHS